MISQKNRRFGFFLLGVAALGLSACVETTSKTEPAVMTASGPILTMPDAPEFKNVKPGTPEELLAAEGKWNIVEEGDVYDPTQAHMAARSKVNPKQMKKRTDLVAHFKPDDAGSEGKFRVLKLEPNKAGWQDDIDISGGFEVAETSITKPTQKVVGTELVASIRSAFAQDSQQAMQEDIQAFDVASAEAGVVDESTLAPVSQVEAVVADGVVRPPILPDSRKKFGTVVQDPVQPEPEFNLADARTPQVTVKPEKTKEEGGFLGSLRKTLGVEDNDQDHINKNSTVASASSDQYQPIKNQARLPEKPVYQNAATLKQTQAAAVNAQGQRVRYQMVPSGGQTALKSPAGIGAMASLTGFRSAIHNGKTRIAMDVSTSVRYKVAIDHIRNVLRVKLDNTRWTEPVSGPMRATGMLGSYVASSRPDGSTILEIRLKRKAKIADTMILRPDQTTHHRIVIDLE